LPRDVNVHATPSMRPSAARATLLAVALSYGSQDVALRLVLTLTAAPSPPAVALVKALIQAAAFAPPYFLSQREGNAPPWSVSLGLAAALVASNEFLLEGIKRTSAAKAAFLLQLSVVFTPILEYFVLRRRQGARVWLGALCACVGCAFLTSSPDDSFVIIQQRTGDLLVVAAATAWAAYIVLTAAIPPDAGALEVQVRARCGNQQPLPRRRRRDAA
jgi:drug/metabolite transporter (DMT)-like permease